MVFWLVNLLRQLVWIIITCDTSYNCHGNLWYFFYTLIPFWCICQILRPTAGTEMLLRLTDIFNNIKQIFVFWSFILIIKKYNPYISHGWHASLVIFGFSENESKRERIKAWKRHLRQWFENGTFRDALPSL